MKFSCSGSRPPWYSIVLQPTPSDRSRTRRKTYRRQEPQQAFRLECRNASSPGGGPRMRTTPPTRSFFRLEPTADVDSLTCWRSQHHTGKACVTVPVDTHAEVADLVPARGEPAGRVARWVHDRAEVCKLPAAVKDPTASATQRVRWRIRLSRAFGIGTSPVCSGESAECAGLPTRAAAVGSQSSVRYSAKDSSRRHDHGVCQGPGRRAEALETASAPGTNHRWVGTGTIVPPARPRLRPRGARASWNDRPAGVTVAGGMIARGARGNDGDGDSRPRLSHERAG